MSLLGIDIGTTGTKAIAFNRDGKVIASCYIDYNLLYPKPGWVEFDTEDQFNKIFLVLKKINHDKAVKNDPVEALSLSTFGEGLTPVDQNGRVIHNTIYSTDARSIKELDIILQKYTAEELFKVTGYPPGFICPLNKILWIKNNRPEVYKRTKRILFTDDLFYHKLGISEPRINYALASRTLFFDVRKKIWAEDILSEFDIDVSLFSRLSPSGIEIGKIPEKVAEELGFNPRVSVIVGCHDQPCAAFGVGAIDGGIAADGMGTVECVVTCMEDAITNNKMLSNNFTLQAHAVKDKYVSLAYNLSSGSVVQWFRDNISDGKNETIKKMATSMPHKPSDILALPYFSATGTPYLDPVPKGSIIGLNLGTKKEDIFKGLIEGLVFEICFNIELAEKSGIPVTELRATGGGAKSDYELLLKSSIINKPILRMDIKEAGCLGAMILAGVGKGIFNIKEAIEKFIKIKDRFEPDKEIQEKYMGKYIQYKKIYKLVSELYNKEDRG